MATLETSLQEQHCEACRQGASTVTDEEIAEYHPQVPDWEIVEQVAGVTTPRKRACGRENKGVETQPTSL